MNDKLFNFESVVSANYRKSRKAQNLNWIVYQETKNHVILQAHKHSTAISSPLIINKQKKTIRRGSAEKVEASGKVTIQQLFSCFIGIFKYNGTSYMLFAEHVRLVDFSGGIDVFEVQSVKTISMDDFKLSSDMTDMCNSLMERGFYFSYALDLTKDAQKPEIMLEGVKSPQWLFCVNRKMTDPFAKEKTMEWVIPMIFGRITATVFYIKDVQKNVTAHLVSRLSIADILKLKPTDLFSEMLSSSNSVIKVSIFMDFEGTSGAVNLLVAAVPDIKSFTPKRTFNFYQFFKLFFDVRSFLLNTDDADSAFYSKVMGNKKIFELLDLKDVQTVGSFHNSDIFNWLNERSETIISTDIERAPPLLIGADDCFAFYEKRMGFIASVCIHLAALKLFVKKDTELTQKSLTVEVLENEIQKTLEGFEHIKDFVDTANKHNEEATGRKTGLLSMVFSGINKLTQSSDEIAKVQMLAECGKLLSSILGFNNKFIQTVGNVQKQASIDALSHREVEMCMITHNVAGFAPNIGEGSKFLKYIERPEVMSADILIVCLQEIMLMKTENLKNIITENNMEAKNAWQDYMLGVFGNSHSIFFMESLLGLMTFMFVRTEVMDKIKIKVTKSDLMRIGMFNFANKAFICTKLTINDDAFDVLNCHMSSGITESEYTRRADDLKKAYTSIKNNHETAVSFIVGDLNFRNRVDLQTARDIVKRHNSAKTIEVKQDLVDELLKCDELSKLLRSENFMFLREQPITFLPSYKFFVDTSDYDIAEGKRIPSWTDRVLYMVKDSITLSIKNYMMDIDTKISDHKPVILLCSLKLTDYSKVGS